MRREREENGFGGKRRVEKGKGEGRGRAEGGRFSREMLGGAGGGAGTARRKEEEEERLQLSTEGAAARCARVCVPRPGSSHPPQHRAAT